MNTLWKSLSNLAGKLISTSNTSLITSFTSIRCISLNRLHQRGLEWLEKPKLKKRRNPLEGKPFAKGIVIKPVIKKPRKPNSANRKCVLVKLSTGKEMVAYVPGVGHNLQEHQTVLCRVKKLKDTPGVKLACIRGKYDLPHVKSQK